MAFFCRPTDGDGLSPQIRIQQHFHTCVEAVGIAVQNKSFTHVHDPLDKSSKMHYTGCMMQRMMQL